MRRRSVLTAGLAATLGASVLLAGPISAGPVGEDALRADLDEILADPRLDGAHVGVVVRDPVSGEVLYSRQARQRVTPASNAKLLTSAAALEALGPDHRFRTEVLAAGEQVGPVLRGDLYLRGTGDPTMLAADYDALAEQVADAGIRAVQGRLLADDSFFDDVPLGTGWMWDDEPYYYAAPISALTASPNTDYDSGTAIVRVAPTAEGQPAEVRLDPPTSVLRVENRVRTAAAGTEPDVSVQREHGSTTVVVSGTVPAGAEPVEDFTTVPDPTAYAADLFAQALQRHGVTVADPAGRAVVPAGARVVAQRQSMPLSELLVPFMKLSNNGHAEILVKTMGRVERGVGSWDAGLAVLNDELRGLGVEPDVLRMVDGSGLSTMDGVTPEQLAVLLDNARERPWFQVWYDSLPVAGAADRMTGGTLRNRMGGTAAENNVHAKTGSLTGVTSLSGYVTAANGQLLVFSVVFNQFLGNAPKDLEDSIAVRLAEYSGPDERPSGRPAVPNSRYLVDNPDTPVDETSLECSWLKAC